MQKHSFINKHENAREFCFAGCKIDSCDLSYGFQLEFMYDNSSAVIRIEAPFTVTVNGATYHLDPAKTPPTEMGMAFAVLHKDITAMTVFDNGRLEIYFTDNVSIAADPDPDYEAWTLSGPKHLLIVCVEGGGLTIWSD